MNNQRWLSQNFFTFFITWGIFLPYWTGWLVDAKHLSVSQASVVMGCGLLARATSNLFFFPTLAKYVNNKRLITILAVGALLTALLYIPSSGFSALLVVTILFSIFYPALLPAVESSAATLVQYGNIHYGKSRSYGSFGFVIAVLIISMLTGVFGKNIIFWSMIIGLIGMLLMQQFATPKELLIVPTKEQRAKSLSMKTLWNIKGFPIVLFIVILLQGAHASYYSYGYIYLEDLHVDPFYMGMIINIAVICEILYFMKADTLFTKWRSSSLLLLAAIGSSTLVTNIYVPKCLGIYCLTDFACIILCPGTFCFYSLSNANPSKGANSKRTRHIFCISHGVKHSHPDIFGRLFIRNIAWFILCCYVNLYRSSHRYSAHDTTQISILI